MVDLIKENVIRGLNLKLDKSRNDLIKLKDSYIINNPDSLYKDKRVKFITLIDKLELVNPLGVLRRGYSISSQEGKVVSSVNDINMDKDIIVKFHDGVVDCCVKNVEVYENE